MAPPVQPADSAKLRLRGGRGNATVQRQRGVKRIARQAQVLFGPSRALALRTLH